MEIVRMMDKEIQSKTIIIPFDKSLSLEVKLPNKINELINNQIIKNGAFHGNLDEIYSCTTFYENESYNIILVGLGNIEEAVFRKVYLAFSKGISYSKKFKDSSIAIVLDNVESIANDIQMCKKICELPKLAYYEFKNYKTNSSKMQFDKVEIVCANENISDILKESDITAESIIFARDITNERSNVMTPSRLALEAEQIAKDTNIEVKILENNEMEDCGMGAILGVTRGASKNPKIIIMKYMGDKEDSDIIGIVGKGITYDSGGYSMKSGKGMLNMHADMGGGAAAIGAIKAIAQMNLNINVIAIIPACENMVSFNSYVPGEILKSMSGKTIEVSNTDAEGRLVLVDAITYAIKNLGITKIIDIATLTGAAKAAVGNKTAVVVSNDDKLFEVAREASKYSCEKIWRLDADDELRIALDSDIADIKNSAGSDEYGGGSIIASLFIKEFVENLPWIHIDMAPVNRAVTDILYSPKGATGFGVSLIYNMIKILSKDRKELN